MPVSSAVLRVAPIVAVLMAGHAMAGSGPKQATICPSILQPVCAQDEAGRRTFPNRCLAERAGFAVLREGSCDGAAGRTIIFCTREYLPVCAEKDGVRRSFGNACEARAEDFTIVAQGEC